MSKLTQNCNKCLHHDTVGISERRVSQLVLEIFQNCSWKLVRGNLKATFKILRQYVFLLSIPCMETNCSIILLTVHRTSSHMRNSGKTLPRTQTRMLIWEHWLLNIYLAPTGFVQKGDVFSAPSSHRPYDLQQMVWRMHEQSISKIKCKRKMALWLECKWRYLAFLR